MKAKRMDFEILRLLAIVLVVWNHTGTNGFSLFTQSCSLPNYVLSLLLAIVSKIAVPLFFMISGGLLLNREEPIRVLLKKRVLRVFLALVIFSALNYVLRIHWGTITSPSLHDFLAELWHEGVTEPYWYLYTYLGLLLMLPLLRPMVQHMPDRAFMYLILLNLAFVGILPICGYLLKLDIVNEDFFIPLVMKNGVYFILGYFLAERVPAERMNRSWRLRLWAAALAAVLLTAVLMTIDREQQWHYFERLTLWPVLAVYVSVCALTAAHPVTGKKAAVLAELGGCVFGTYLLEGILRYEYTPLYVALRPLIHMLPACAVFTVAVIVTGMAITLLLRRIPVVKKIL